MVKDKRNGRNMGDLKFFLAKISISKVKRHDNWEKLFVPHSTKNQFSRNGDIKEQTNRKMGKELAL